MPGSLLGDFAHITFNIHNDPLNYIECLFFHREAVAQRSLTSSTKYHQDSKRESWELKTRSVRFSVLLFPQQHVVSWLNINLSARSTPLLQRLIPNGCLCRVVIFYSILYLGQFQGQGETVRSVKSPIHLFCSLPQSSFSRYQLVMWLWYDWL